MADPQIKYVQTPDGVNIAYMVIGDRRPAVVITDALYSNIQAEWSDPAQRRLYEGIAQLATLVRYDHRGMGMSDRDRADFSLEGMALDLEAVVDRALPGRMFALVSFRGVTTPVAVTYAARHPERLTHLVLTTPMARPPASFIEQMQAMVDAPGADERFFSESLARLVQGWDDEEASKRIAAMMRASISFDGFKRWLAASKGWDVRNLLPLVRTPTLLTSYKDSPWFGGEQVRELAALLPDSRIAIIDAATTEARNAQSAAAVAEFLGSAVPAEYQVAAPRVSATAIILFADIVDSTALTERLGDVAFRGRSSKLDAAMRRAIASAGGTAVDGKVLGDGVMAVFGAAREAIAAALQCNAAAADAGLELHLGIHAGDVIREEGNVFGGAVNIASRICGLSAPGEILVSDVVRGMARSSAGVVFEDRGEQEMKGVGESVRVYAVRGSA